MNAIIVDDHPLARIAIRNLLDTNGIAATTKLDSGDQMIQIVEKTKPGLLIIDVDIPGISGIEMLEQLRRRYYAGVIITISTKNEIFYGKRSAEYGANGFAGKKEGMNNIFAVVKVAKNGYSHSPFPLEHLTGSFASEQDKLDMLSNQETRVLRYALNGTDYSTIASKMNISNKAVSTHKSRLMEKLDCSSSIEIYDYVQRNKIGQSNAGTLPYLFDGHPYHRVIYGCKLSSAS